MHSLCPTIALVQKGTMDWWKTVNKVIIIKEKISYS